MSGAQHTPGPWTLSARPAGPWWHISAGQQAIACVHATDKKATPHYAAMFRANAERIVQCVNAHDGLVEAARKARAFLNAGCFDSDADALALAGELDAAIAKATGSATIQGAKNGN